MSIFMDTGLFYALQNTRAQHHDEAVRALSEAGTGRYGRLFTSEYVYDEAVTLVRSHRGYDEAMLVGDRILGEGDYPPAYELLMISEDDFERSRTVFERYDDHPLSFTDATTIALMETNRIDYLLSFDDDFDGIVDRLDPGEIE